MNGINDPIIDPINQPFSIPEQQLEDDLLGFSLWHHFRPDTRFFGRFTLLNGDPNELHFRLRYFTVDNLWTLVVEWYQLFERLTNVVNDLTPYVPLLGSYEPFYRISARVTRSATLPGTITRESPSLASSITSPPRYTMNWRWGAL